MASKSRKRDWLSRASHAIAKRDAQRDLPPYAVWVRPAEVIGRGWYSICYRVDDGPIVVAKKPLRVDEKTWDDYCRFQAQFQKRFRRRVERAGRRNRF